MTTSEFTLDWTLRIGIEPDTTKPKTVLNDPPSTYWRNSSYVISLSASDEWSGVAETIYALGRTSVPHLHRVGHRQR